MLTFLIVPLIAAAADSKYSDELDPNPFGQCVLAYREDGKIQRARFDVVPSAENHKVYEAKAGDLTVRIVHDSGASFTLGKDDLSYQLSLQDYPRRRALGEIEQRRDRAAFDRRQAAARAEAEDNLKQLRAQGCDPNTHPMARGVRRRLAEVLAIPFAPSGAHAEPPPEPTGRAKTERMVFSVSSANAREPNGSAMTSVDKESVNELGEAIRAGKVKNEADLFTHAVDQNGALLSMSSIDRDKFAILCRPQF